MSTKLNINVIEDGSITKSKLSEDITGSLDSVSNKADKATTLSGYGITDAYDKTEIDSQVSDINTNIDTKLSKSGGTMSGSIKSHSIVPETNLTYNLGGSSNKYKEIFSQYVNSDRLYGRLDARYIDTMAGTFTQTSTTLPFVNLVSKGSVNIFAGASSTELKVERWSGSLGENATWEDFSNDEDTIKNVTGVFSDLYRPSNYLNVAYGETAAVGDKIRITFLPNSRYSYLHFILINFSTNGGKHVITIEKNTWNTTNATYNDDWTVVHDAKSISGWSGFNVYSMTSSNVFGQTSNTNGYGIRFTIELTELTYPQYDCNGAIYSIRGFTLQYPFANPSKSSNNNLRVLGVPYFTDEQRMIYTDNGIITKGQVSPYRNKQYDMGSSSLMWNNVYSNKYYEDGIDISTKYALKSDLIANAALNSNGINYDFVQYTSEMSVVSLVNGTYYKWVDMPSELTLTAPSPIDDSYNSDIKIALVIGDSIPSLTINNVQWVNGTQPTLEANTTLEINIFDNRATYAVFK